MKSWIGLCCNEWEERYPLTTVSALCREISDHVPLYICSGDLPKSEAPFIFENAWLLREGIDKVVWDTWTNAEIQGSSLDRWQCKIRLLRAKLKGWNRDMNAWYRDLKKHILMQLDDIDKYCEVHGLTADMRQNQKDLRAQLDRLMKQEELKWKQKGKVKEILQVASNTK